MNSIMWDFSLYCDEQMANDPYWIESEEGQFAMMMVKKENDRLTAVLKAQGKYQECSCQRYTAQRNKEKIFS